MRWSYPRTGSTNSKVAVDITNVIYAAIGSLLNKTIQESLECANKPVLGRRRGTFYHVQPEPGQYIEQFNGYINVKIFTVGLLYP